MKKSALKAKMKPCKSCGLPIKPEELVETPMGYHVHRICWDLVKASMGVEARERAMAELGFVEMRPGVWVKKELVPAK
jgi:hypothetical protein